MIEKGFRHRRMAAGAGDGLTAHGRSLLEHDTRVGDVIVKRPFFGIKGGNDVTNITNYLAQDFRSRPPQRLTGTEGRTESGAETSAYIASQNRGATRTQPGNTGDKAGMTDYTRPPESKY